MGDRAIEEIADVLAYQQVRRNNPKADSKIWGYRAFSQDQRDFLTEQQKDNAKEILLTLEGLGYDVE